MIQGDDQEPLRQFLSLARGPLLELHGSHSWVECLFDDDEDDMRLRICVEGRLQTVEKWEHFLAICQEICLEYLKVQKGR